MELLVASPIKRPSISGDVVVQIHRSTCGATSARVRQIADSIVNAIVRISRNSSDFRRLRVAFSNRMKMERRRKSSHTRINMVRLLSKEFVHARLTRMIMVALKTSTTARPPVTVMMMMMMMHLKQYGYLNHRINDICTL